MVGILGKAFYYLASFEGTENVHSYIYNIATENGCITRKITFHFPADRKGLVCACVGVVLVVFNRDFRLSPVRTWLHANAMNLRTSKTFCSMAMAGRTDTYLWFTVSRHRWQQNKLSCADLFELISVMALYMHAYLLFVKWFEKYAAPRVFYR